MLLEKGLHALRCGLPHVVDDMAIRKAVDLTIDRSARVTIREQPDSSLSKDECFESIKRGIFVDCARLELLKIIFSQVGSFRLDSKFSSHLNDLQGVETRFEKILVHAELGDAGDVSNQVLEPVRDARFNTKIDIRELAECKILTLIIRDFVQLLDILFVLFVSLIPLDFSLTEVYNWFLRICEKYVILIELAVGWGMDIGLSNDWQKLFYFSASFYRVFRWLS